MGRGTPTSGSDTRAGRIKILPQRSHHSFVKRLDTVLLFLTDPTLRLEDRPELQNIILDLLDDIEGSGNGIIAGHFLNVLSLWFTGILANDLRIYNIALCSDLCLGSSREHY